MAIKNRPNLILNTNKTGSGANKTSVSGGVGTTPLSSLASQGINILNSGNPVQIGDIAGLIAQGANTIKNDPAAGQNAAQYYNTYKLYSQVQDQNEQMLAAMEQQRAEQEAALRRQTQATVDSINSNRAGIEDAYNEAQRQAYINSVLQRNQMGDYLAAAGYSGGMAESTMAQIANNYENNRRQATSERDAANLEIDRLVAEAMASGDASLADSANSYYDRYLASLQQQQQLDYQMNQDLMGQLTAEQERQRQAAQLQYERDQYNREYEEAGAKESAAQDFNTFLNTYKGKYNKKATYDKWIQNLQAMNDPYGYNAQKIAYLQQYINKTFGAGGTETKLNDRRIDETPGQVSNAAKSLVNELSGKFPAGITAEAKANAVMNAISKGNYSDADQNYILSAFGY